MSLSADDSRLTQTPPAQARFCTWSRTPIQSSRRCRVFTPQRVYGHKALTKAVEVRFTAESPGGRDATTCPLNFTD